MPRAGLSAEVVTTRAADLADAEGWSALNLASLAERLGVRVPSLYKHVAGLPDLQRRVALAGMRDLYAALTAAGPATDRSGLLVLAAAYRDFAVRHPGRYAAALRAPDPDDDALLEVASRLTALLLDVVSSYGYDGDAAVHAARTVRSALHGFVSLSAAGGFGMPQDVDATYAHLVRLLDAGLAAGAVRP